MERHLPPPKPPLPEGLVRHLYLLTRARCLRGAALRVRVTGTPAVAPPAPLGSLIIKRSATTFCCFNQGVGGRAGEEDNRGRGKRALITVVLGVDLKR